MVRRRTTYSNYSSRAARSAHARGEAQFRTYDTSYIQPNRRRNNRRSGILRVVLAIAVIALLIFVVVNVARCATGCSGLLSSDQSATIEVKSGMATTEIGDELVTARLISKSSEFTKEVTKQNAENALKTGIYTFSGGTSIEDIVKQIVSGPNQDNQIVVTEGMTLASIAKEVETKTDGAVKADAFTKQASNASVYANDFSFLQTAGTNSLEGFLFPKSYNVSSNSNADSIIREMLTQFQNETKNLDLSYVESQGLNFYDMVKLASIVEKEANNDQDIRKKVAGVFYNRLDETNGQTYGYLQSDATTAYEVGHDPSAEEVHSDSSYSTYTHAGLPPTPICSPSLAAMEAVCSPEQTDYFYFYFSTDANGNTTYSFSTTYEEHQDSFSN